MLDRLPLELFHRVCRHVSFQDFTRLTQTNHKLYSQRSPIVCQLEEEGVMVCIEQAPEQRALEILEHKQVRNWNFDQMTFYDVYEYEDVRWIERALFFAVQDRKHLLFEALIQRFVSASDRGWEDDFMDLAFALKDFEIFEIMIRYHLTVPSTYLARILVVAVDIDDVDLFVRVLRLPTLDLGDEYSWMIEYSAKDEKIPFLSLMLDDPRLDPSVEQNNALISASRSGHLEAVQLLMQDHRVSETCNVTWAMLNAGAEGFPKIFEYFYQNFTFRFDKYPALVAQCMLQPHIANLILTQEHFDYEQIGYQTALESVRMSHPQALKRLLQEKQIDVAANDSAILLECIQRGERYQHIQLLLKDGRIDPLACDGLMIRTMVMCEHFDTLRLIAQEMHTFEPSDDNQELVKRALTSVLKTIKSKKAIRGTQSHSRDSKVDALLTHRHTVSLGDKF
ncbi:hypothetical protein EDD86DRAFT_220671 [Gorgonomyces haynaldii]|nr:hypothetical protein EDD86DRAFT_220671 [Gorgonomyces haynaldii]